MKYSSVFDRYPQLTTLKGLVPDEIVEKEIGSRADELDADIARAKKTIPTCNLNKIFPANLEKGKIQLENFLGHWGNVSIEELCKICLIVNYIKPECILELGTYNGMTTLQMALNAPASCITYTLDLPEAIANTLQLSELDMLVARHFKKKFGTTTGSYFKGRSDVNIKQLLGNSATFDYSVIPKQPNLIFVDAAHDYQNKKIDSENAFKLIAENGVIIWHDFTSPANPDVTKYLADISTQYPLFHLRNTMLVVFWNNHR
jgi:predicted O-methyltransferase YrrM